MTTAFASSFLLQHAIELQAQSSDSGFWMPVDASTIAPKVDFLFYLILAISAIFFALIVGVMIAFVIKYHAKPGMHPQQSPDHGVALELTWSIIPLIIVLLIFYL